MNLFRKLLPPALFSPRKVEPFQLFPHTDSSSLLQYWKLTSDASTGGHSSGSISGFHDKRHTPPNMCGIHFTGNLSLDMKNTEKGYNQTGFCSIRANVNVNISSQLAVRLRVLSDGKRYRVLLGSSALLPGDVYMYTIDGPRDAWHDVVIPFAGFQWYSKGKPAWEINPSFDGASLLSIGITIADDQEGPFDVRIASFEVIPRMPTLET